MLLLYILHFCLFMKLVQRKEYDGKYYEIMMNDVWYTGYFFVCVGNASNKDKNKRTKGEKTENKKKKVNSKITCIWMYVCVYVACKDICVQEKKRSNCAQKKRDGMQFCSIQNMFVFLYVCALYTIICIVIQLHCKYYILYIAKKYSIRYANNIILIKRVIFFFYSHYYML
eukprot:UN04265